MRRILTTTLFALLLFSAYSQKDTVVKKQQRGFLFLSAYHYLYDFEGGHMRLEGFPDLFYPTNDIRKESFLKDTVVLSKGVRVEGLIPGRYGLKKRGTKVNGKDSSNFYRYNSFFIVPVILDYKTYSDDWPLLRRRNFYAFTTTAGKELRFEYLNEAAIITDLKEVNGKAMKMQLH